MALSKKKLVDALTTALAACPPVRRKMIKTKLRKNKLTHIELLSFIREHAPKEYAVLICEDNAESNS
tara:strand:+ start:2327 stop:2527 length:201 start_codon:yes stop_codon:yes gene_type:complete